MPQNINTDTLPGEIYIILAAVLWGTTGTSQALAPVNTNPLSVAAMRMLVGGIILAIINIIRKGIKPHQTSLSWHTFTAALSIAAYQAFFFTGVLRTGVAIGTLLTIGSSPIFGGAIGFLLQKEKINPRWILATTIALIGTILLMFSKHERGIDFLGILFTLSAGFSYAMYVYMNKKVITNQPMDESLAVIFFTSGLLLLPILFFTDTTWICQPNGILVVLNLGITTVVIAYSLFVKGLALLPVSEATTLTLAEPLTAGILGIFFLKESLTFSVFAGMLLIFIGLLLLLRDTHSE